MKLDLRPHGTTAKERIIRTILLFFVFIIVAWAFWYNNQSTLKKLKEKNSLYDQTQTLSNQEKDFIKGFIGSMRTEFGISVKIAIKNDTIEEPEYGSTDLFIGISPPNEQVIIHFPGLVRHALGSNFINSLQNGHFDNSFKNGQWPAKLQSALVMTWQKLVEVEVSQPQ